MIYITGDTHGEAEMKRLSKKRWCNRPPLTKKDYVIVAGDFGLIFTPNQSAAEKYWTDWLTEQPWTTLFVDGNHENHDMLRRLEKKDKFGGVVGWVNDSILHLKRGEVYTVGGKKIFTMGGACSIDKHNRTEGVSWWPEEIPNCEEIEHALKNLEKHDWKVDTVITHTCPTSVAEAWLRMNNFSTKDQNATTEKFLEHVALTAEYGNWYFGHWHDDWSYGKFRMLYQDIIPMK